MHFIFCSRSYISSVLSGLMFLRQPHEPYYSFASKFMVSLEIPTLKFIPEFRKPNLASAPLNLTSHLSHHKHRVLATLDSCLPRVNC